MTILEKKVLRPLGQRRERVFVGGPVDRIMPVSPYAGGMTAIRRWLSESDATEIDRVDNFRILKGFQAHPSFWCCFDNVVAG